MKLNIKIYLDTEVHESDVEYPTQNKISFTVDPGDRPIKINKITLNGIEANIFHNTSFHIDDSDIVLTSIHEITQKGTFSLCLDDLYILSHRSSNWHCSAHKDDYIFNYEFTNNSFIDTYRDRDHKGFENTFVPCFGCSFTFGAYQPASSTWPNLLSQKTDRTYLNLGVAGSGIDGIYHNMKRLHKEKNFNQCVILFPNFERRVVRCKIDGKYIGIHSTIDISGATSEYHFYRNPKLTDRMQKVRDSVVKDVENQYSKSILTKIIDYCNNNKIKLSVSSWDDEVYHHLKTQDHVNLLAKFPPLSLFTERAHDGYHPHRKHYKYFVDDIIKIL